ncbi:hypothetical protein BV25DRAFT_1922016 [Artomyces pyxidatus]|uniref:Uncharacterized protein n=1 Tax=Artomyces pyxidatus TaxID=48021 RepID=A0ACB8SF98_9AGAM|nr:hypothetical protein BV25DRAFT_1922016 [Artomyces pyxidatus]
MGVTTPDKPKRSRAKAAPKSDEQRAHEKAERFAADQRLHVALEAASDTIRELIDELAEQHNRSFDEISNLLHLGGHILKDRRRPAPHNALSYCWARFEDGRWSRDDPERQELARIVEKAEGLGGHHDLSEEEKQVLVDCLQAERDAKDTGAVRKPLVQMHDIRTTLEKVNTELTNVHQRSELEYVLFCSRSKSWHLGVPAMYATATGFDFITQVLRLKASELANRFEVFCLNHAGIQGVIEHISRVNGTETKNTKKSMIVSNLSQQLLELTGRDTLRLEWTRWDKKITEPFGVVLEGWPLAGSPVSPSDLKNSDINTVFQAVIAGTCRLRTQTSAEKLARQHNATAPHTSAPEHAQPPSDTVTSPVYQRGGAVMSFGHDSEKSASNPPRRKRKAADQENVVPSLKKVNTGSNDNTTSTSGEEQAPQIEPPPGNKQAPRSEPSPGAEQVPRSEPTPGEEQAPRSEPTPGEEQALRIERTQPHDENTGTLQLSTAHNNFDFPDIGPLTRELQIALESVESQVVLGAAATSSGSGFDRDWLGVQSAANGWSFNDYSMDVNFSKDGGGPDSSEMTLGSSD